MKYNITNHCKERYIERILNHAKSENLFKVMLEELRWSKNITGEIANKVPRFILYVKERYDNNINILEYNNQTIFILTKVKDTQDTYAVLTCFNKHNYLDMFKNSHMSNEEIYHKLKLLKSK